MIKVYYIKIGDWGLGMGIGAQSPIPNPQSPNFLKLSIILINFKL